MESEMEHSSQASKHQWQAEEDKVLVECLLEMKRHHRYISDNGFKAGYLGHPEVKLAEKIPGCTLKGVPHIQSRIRTLKSWWQGFHDVLCGTNKSGFGWDSERKCVVAERQVWDDYLKSHSKHAFVRGKIFKHYEDLSEIWGKDRAAEKDSQDSVDVNDEIDRTQTNNVVETQGDQQDEETDVASSDIPPSQQAGSSSRKRKRAANGQHEVIAECLREIYTKMEQGFQAAIEKLCAEVHRLAHDAAMDERAERLLEDLLAIPDLTVPEVMAAHGKLIRDNRMLVVFPTIPTNWKATWIRQHID